jgi:hypothetical protein
LAIGEQGLKLGGSKRHLGEWLGPVKELANIGTETAIKNV